jgi:hypothetical protein
MACRRWAPGDRLRAQERRQVSLDESNATPARLRSRASRPRVGAVAEGNGGPAPTPARAPVELTIAGGRHAHARDGGQQRQVAAGLGDRHAVREGGEEGRLDEPVPGEIPGHAELRGAARQSRDFLVDEIGQSCTSRARLARFGRTAIERAQAGRGWSRTTSCWSDAAARTPSGCAGAPFLAVCRRIPSRA